MMAAAEFDMFSLRRVTTAKERLRNAQPYIQF